MSTGYRRQQQTLSSDGGPSWLLLHIAVAIGLCLVAFPWIVIGYVAQRYLSRWLQSHRRFSLLFWLMLLFTSAYLIYMGNQHNALLQIVNSEFLDYVAAGKRYQWNFQRWPFSALWAETWPVWLHTWPGIGIAGFVSEVFTDIRLDTLRALRQDQQYKERKVQRQQQKAKKRTAHPKRLPDNIGGMMVMGVPINDEKE